MSKSEKVPFFAIHPFLNLCQSAKECPNCLKNWQLTNFDMGFQKKTLEAEKKSIFSNGRFLTEPPLKIEIFTFKHTKINLFFYVCFKVKFLTFKHTN
jgi:hypothetical protein